MRSQLPLEAIARGFGLRGHEIRDVSVFDSGDYRVPRLRGA
jgi:hypothetical protein